MSEFVSPDMYRETFGNPAPSEAERELARRVTDFKRQRANRERDREEGLRNIEIHTERTPEEISELKARLARMTEEAALETNYRAGFDGLTDF
jgi:hypothetical protein